MSVAEKFIAASFYILLTQHAFCYDNEVNGTLPNDWPPRISPTSKPSSALTPSDPERDVCVNHCVGIADKCATEAEIYSSNSRLYQRVKQLCDQESTTCSNACFGLKPAGVNPPPPQEGEAPTLDYCLTYSTPKYVGGSIGECTKKDGTTGHRYFTYVHSTKTNGCPIEIDFEYFNKDIDSIEQYSTPFNVQTCDYPAQSISVKK